MTHNRPPTYQYLTTHRPFPSRPLPSQPRLTAVWQLQSHSRRVARTKPNTAELSLILIICTTVSQHVALLRNASRGVLMHHSHRGNRFERRLSV